MRLDTTARHLRTALHAFRGIVERRNTIPVLGTVKFEGGKLHANNLDIAASIVLPAIGEPEGAAAIDFFGLAGLVGHIDDDVTVSITDEDGLSAIAFNGSEYRMPSIAATEFPEFGAVDGVTTHCANLGLIDALRRVRFSICTEETRYYLNGVAFMRGKDGQALVVATDGHRLAMMPLDQVPDEAVGKILPRGLVQALCRQKREPETMVFSQDGRTARFGFAGMSLSTKLIDGTYPDIFRVIPTDAREYFTVDRMQALRIFRRLDAFRRGSFSGVRLDVDAGSLTISMKGAEQSADESVAVLQPGSDRYTAGFNLAYLIQAFSSFTGETVTFSADGAPSGSPVNLTSDDDALRIVQMPMRV